jgi:hypothetical protein
MPKVVRPGTGGLGALRLSPMGNRRFQRGDQYAFLAVRVVVLALLISLAFAASSPVGHILGAVGSVLWAVATVWAFKKERRRAAALPESPTG